MKIHIRTKNFSLTPGLETLVSQKLTEPIQKLLVKVDVKSNILLEIELEKITRHHRKGMVWSSEINLSLPKKPSILRVKTIAENIKNSLNLIKHKFFREFEKYKNKNK